MNLRFLVDQNIPREICDFIRSRSPDWHVNHVGDVGHWGAPDSRIIEWARANGSIVITLDEDFADAHMFPIRLPSWRDSITCLANYSGKTEEALVRVITEIVQENLAGSLAVVDGRRIRVRRSARHG